MQQLMTFLAVIGGLIFSIAVAVVVEEFIFGKIFQMFFTPLSVRVVRPVLQPCEAVPVRIRAQYKR